MDGSDEHGAESDPQKDDRTVHGSQHGAEDGTQSGDVQELDQEDLPSGQGHIVHTAL